MKALWQLNTYFVKYKWRFLLGIVMVVISNIFAVFPAQFVRKTFDEVRTTLENPGGDLEEVKSVLIIYGLLIVLMALMKGLFQFFMRQTLIVMSRYIEFDLKNAIFEQYQRLSLAFYKRNNTGDLMNRISEDVTRVRMYLGPAVMYTIQLTSLIIIVVSLMVSINLKLTIYVLTPLPILAYGIYRVSDLINRKSDIVQKQLSGITTFVQETFSGIRVLKTYVREESSNLKFEEECKDYKTKSLDLAQVNALFFPMMILLIGLSTLLTIYIGGKQAIAGEITAGNIAEFVIYVNMLTWPVASLGWVTSLVQRAEASMTRINEFMDVKPEVINHAEDHTPIKGEIEFKNVHFTYPDSGTKGLDGVSFKINAGETLAIIGKTGSGKSTVAAVLGRLYDIEKGEIKIDGKPIRDLNLYSLRRSIGYVPQEAFLFSDTIAGNIGFGVDNASQKEVEEAAKKAHVYNNIIDFPKGFQTKVGERGITLSGGQKQRVSIARALLKDPSIMVFDDCLSAVDTETEEEILQNLRQVSKEKTTLIISHRASSVKHANRILVLDQGKIIEEGSPEELMRIEDGYYKELYMQQLKDEAKPTV